MLNNSLNNDRDPMIYYRQKLTSARMNLIFVIVFTVLNVVLRLMGSDKMMLFSASVPYLAIWHSSVNTVRFLVPSLIVAVVVIAVYFVSWLLSKKNYKWLVVSFVMMIIDSIVMLAFYAKYDMLTSGLLDIVFHAFIIYYIAVGLINGKKINDLSASLKNSDNAPKAVSNDQAACDDDN